MAVNRIAICPRVTIARSPEPVGPLGQGEVLRLPRVRRLNYMRALLGAVGTQGCNRDDARTAILEVVIGLDFAKAAALGRRQPLPPKGQQLVEQCVQLAFRLGLVGRRGSQLSPTNSGISIGATRDDLPVWFELLWKTFPNFRTMVKGTFAQPAGLLLPVTRYGGDFGRAIAEQGIPIDHMSFEIARDLATELRVINWHPVFGENGDSQRVFATGTICIRPTHVYASPSCARGTRDSDPVSSRLVGREYLIDSRKGDSWHFIGTSIATRAFEQALWRQYLELTDRVPKFPVLYPTLRDLVCETLRIPDALFDEGVQELLREPQRVEIYPAEGVLDYSSKASITYKQLPPRTPSGQFMTFLKIDRKAPTDGR